MYTPLLTTALLVASVTSARPATRLALADQPVFDAPIWGAPCLTKTDGGKYYSFATNMYGMHVPGAVSTDFKKWDWIKDHRGKKKDAMPHLPSWIDAKPRLWAPDVSKLNSTHYIMYFTAIKKGSHPTKHCIGAAYSKNVDGPYTSMKSGGQDVPWFCPVDHDQAIDPNGFTDHDGSRYVVFKHNMRNKTVHAPHWAWYTDTKLSGVSLKANLKALSPHCGSQGPPYAPTPIKIRKVAADGVTKLDQRRILVDNRGYHDIGNTESPSLMRAENGNYFLFFAHGCFMDGTYATSYAVSTSGIYGPYKRQETPFLSSTTPKGYRLSGPGTLDVLDDGKLGVFFSHEPDAMGKRPMRTLRFHIEGDKAVIDKI